MKNLTTTLTIFLWIQFVLFSQGALQGLNMPSIADEFPSCGSQKLMQQMSSETFNFMEQSNQVMQDLSLIVQNQQNDRANENLLVIPVVFHVVYSNEEENLADSVIHNQLDILNKAFRRQNENASQTRPVFLDLVADTKIEFVLAAQDPNGAATDGITRTPTDVSYFGGVLPYDGSQTDEIMAWVNDSLYYNMFRLTKTELGGIDAWDPNTYLNIWIGDLRIFQPMFNNFEELVFIGLATPPLDHPNWPEDAVGPIYNFEQGVLMHYVAVGANNPNSFPNPYQNLNNPVKHGKVLIHEVGHYLGLRHIWGDGDCSVDDFIWDTPNAANHSGWGCNLNANTCVDDINGVDLPNMVENYMDYSSGSCQNSFTKGQSDMMRAVLGFLRPSLAEVISLASLDNLNASEDVVVFPNPFQNTLHIENAQQGMIYNLYDLTGQLLLNGKFLGNSIDFSHLASGTYFIELLSVNKQTRLKIVKL